MKPTLAHIRTAMVRKGYVLFENGDYNLNLIGVRTKDDSSNKFNDWFCVYFKVDGAEQFIAFPATTDPGLYWRRNPMSVLGTAILTPGQHRGMWKLGLHRGDYRALVQRKPVTVFRDNDSDDTLDFDVPTETGLFGINGHRATKHGESKQVDKWSAGCQVIADSCDYDLLICLCEIAAIKYGNSFTYTLLEEGDLT